MRKKPKKPSKTGTSSTRSQKSGEALSATIGIRAAIERQKAHEKPPRFTTGRIPGYIDDASRDLINAVLDTPGLNRLLVLGSPADDERKKFDEADCDICLVVIRGPMAPLFADAIRRDPRWR